MRVLLITGGGGAGVTTFAAATAVRAARDGMRTCLLGTDPASLASALGPDAGRPRSLATAAPQPDDVLGDEAPAVMRWLAALLAWCGFDEALAGDLNVLPESRAVAALLSAGANAERDDLTVVDLGPAAEALAVLHLLATDPAADGEAEPFNRTAVRLVGPLLARLADLPRPGDPVRAAGRLAADRFQHLQSLLRDGTALSVRVVLPADTRGPRIERETRTVLGLHGIGLDAVVSRDHKVAGHETFKPAGLTWPWSPTVPTDCEHLAALASAAYGEQSPDALLSPPLRPHAELHEAGADFIVPVPPRPAGDFAVSRRGPRLTVRVGPWRRTFHLPALFEPLRGRRAWHDGQGFRVRFER
jgi:arsenite-transporting ATPase